MADGLKAARTVHQVVREFNTIPVESGDLTTFFNGSGAKLAMPWLMKYSNQSDGLK